MKRLLLIAAVATFTLGVGGSSAGQVPGRGFSRLVCIVQQLAPELSGGPVSVDIDDQGAVDGYGTAIVTITHGTSGSSHIVSYFDANENEQLDCGDVVLSVS